VGLVVDPAHGAASSGLGGGSSGGLGGPSAATLPSPPARGTEGDDGGRGVQPMSSAGFFLFFNFF